MTERRPERPVLNYTLGLMCAAAILAAVLVVGPATGSQTGTTRTARAVEGVVQQTVSGSGNVEPSSQLNLGFKTSGTVAHIYVHQGELVTQGQLIATLDPQSAEVALEQAKAGLMAAQANLAKEEETGGAGTASTGTQGKPEKAGGKQPATSSSTGEAAVAKENNNTVSAATREANLASARATVRSDRLGVESAEQSVQDTKLFAPQTGTIVSLSGQVGEVVSASGTTRASSSSGSSGISGAATSCLGRGGSGSSGCGSTGSGSSGSGSSGSSGSGSSGSSGAAFAVLSDLSSMQLVAPLSESEIVNVRVGQIATVTVEALQGRKLAARVSEVATLATSSSGVVSYDVAFALDQTEPGLKPGMSATAEVVVKQAEGVNVPSSAISAGSVTVVRDGKHVRRPVTTGLAGNSTTIVLSGLNAGEEVALPSATANSAASLISRLGSRLGGGGLGGRLGGGGGPGGGGGGAILFRGGG